MNEVSRRTVNLRRSVADFFAWLFGLPGGAIPILTTTTIPVSGPGVGTGKEVYYNVKNITITKVTDDYIIVSFYVTNNGLEDVDTTIEYKIINESDIAIVYQQDVVSTKLHTEIQINKTLDITEQLSINSTYVLRILIYWAPNPSSKVQGEVTFMLGMPVETVTITGEILNTYPVNILSNIILAIGENAFWKQYGAYIFSGTLITLAIIAMAKTGILFKKKYIREIKERI
jgi:hypothetical protein